MIGGDYLNRRIIHREELLEAMERTLEYFDTAEWNEDFKRGVTLGLEKLKHELGYDKMISRKAIRKSNRERD